MIVIDANAPRTDDTPERTEAVTRTRLVRPGMPPPTNRIADLAARLYRAMRSYRASPLRTHLVNVRSAEDSASSDDGAWAALAETSELHVLPGTHTTLVVADGATKFSGVVRDAIDRAMARARVDRPAVVPPSDGKPVAAGPVERGATQ